MGNGGGFCRGYPAFLRSRLFFAEEEHGLGSNLFPAGAPSFIPLPSGLRLSL